MGVLPIAEALQRAKALELDLVEVAPKADPPVCRIMDYGKFKYLQSKREQEARKKQTIIQVKEIKVRPKTDEHDMNVKIRHIRRFLEDGDKVKITVRFRGREMSYASKSGFDLLQQIVATVSDLSKVESPPRMEGRTMMAIVAPLAQKRKPGGKKDGAGEMPAARGRRNGKPAKAPGQTAGEAEGRPAETPAGPTETQEER